MLKQSHLYSGNIHGNNMSDYKYLLQGVCLYATSIVFFLSFFFYSHLLFTLLGCVVSHVDNSLNTFSTFMQICRVTLLADSTALQSKTQKVCGILLTCSHIVLCSSVTTCRLVEYSSYCLLVFAKRFASRWVFVLCFRLSVARAMRRGICMRVFYSVFPFFFFFVFILTSALHMWQIEKKVKIT